MTRRPVYIVRIIGEVVGYVSEVLTPVLAQYDPTIRNVNYQFGTAKEINDTITKWDQQPETSELKFPCIWLMMSFKERVTIAGYTANLQIIIARDSKPEIKADDRYTNNFEPVLYPVYLEFMNQLQEHGGISMFEFADHDKTDWPFWGGTDDQIKNPFAEKMDIIELTNLNLTFLTNNSCPTS